MSFGLLKNVIYKLFVYKSYIWYIYKQDLALNNLPELVGIPTNQPTNQLEGDSTENSAASWRGRDTVNLLS